MARLYSLLDRKLREFGVVLTAQNDETMLRELHSNLKGRESTQGKYPEDFDLYRIGEVDVETGVVGGENPPRLVMNLKELLSDNGKAN